MHSNHIEELCCDILVSLDTAKLESMPRLQSLVLQ